MATMERTTTTCPVCTHHVAVYQGVVSLHRVEGRDCDGVGLLVMDPVTPIEAVQLDENLHEVAEQISGFVAIHRLGMQSGDELAALMNTSRAVMGQGYSRDDLVRLLAFAVARIAGGVS